MAEPSGDRDSGQSMEGVCGIFTLLLSLVLSTATHWLSWLPGVLRGRGVPGPALDEPWEDLGDALAMPSAPGDLLLFPNIDREGQYNARLGPIVDANHADDLLLFPNIDREGQYNARLVDQLPEGQDPVENIDADNAAAAEADLEMLLAVAEVASLPRQIERDEANITMVRRPQVLSSFAESGVAPSSMVDDVTAGALQHLLPQAPVPETVAAHAPAPDFVGILAGVLLQRIEDKAYAEAQVEDEVVTEASPPGLLEQILNGARGPQFATPNMAVPEGNLESNLEERMPGVDHPEAGDSADLQAEITTQDDVENLEVGEPHAKGTQ